MIKTFRGLLADGGQDHIRLQTIKGKVGYRITKFQIISPSPSTITSESTIKIYKTKQTSVTGAIDFTDSNLLAVAFWSSNSGATYYADDMTVIFDSELFNQDIYITHEEQVGSAGCNFYFELEVIPLDDAGAEYTTLKDMRST